MNATSTRVCWVLSFGFGLAILVGCAGGTVTQPTQPEISSAHSDSNRTAIEPLSPLRGEVLATKRISLSSKCGTTDWRSTFSALGEANGPLRGIFVADGYWHQTDLKGVKTWAFSEDFSITTYTKTRYGTIDESGFGRRFDCRSVGSLTFSYKFSGEHGSVRIEKIAEGDFKEVFE
jgi:hypothetical protein